MCYVAFAIHTHCQYRQTNLLLYIHNGFLFLLCMICNSQRMGIVCTILFYYKIHRNKVCSLVLLHWVNFCVIGKWQFFFFLSAVFANISNGVGFFYRLLLFQDYYLLCSLHFLHLSVVDEYLQRNQSYYHKRYKQLKYSCYFFHCGCCFNSV